METANAYIRLAGDLGQTIPKLNVPAAELRLLERLHGDGSVIQVELAGEIEVDPRDFKTYLTERYAKDGESEQSKLLEKLFPGETPNFPGTLKEVGFEVEATAPKKRGPKKKKVTPAKAEPASAPDTESEAASPLD